MILFAQLIQSRGICSQTSQSPMLFEQAQQPYKVNEYTVENANLQGLSQAGAPVMTRSSSSSPGSINSNSPKVKIPTKVSGALIIQNRLRACED